jgi:hypothetical protein
MGKQQIKVMRAIALSVTKTKRIAFEYDWMAMAWYSGFNERILSEECLSMTNYTIQ